VIEFYPYSPQRSPSPDASSTKHATATDRTRPTTRRPPDPIAGLPIIDGHELIGILSQAHMAKHLPDERTGEFGGGAFVSAGKLTTRMRTDRWSGLPLDHV